MNENGRGKCRCTFSCGVYTGPIESWDVSGIDNFGGLFKGIAGFDGDVSNWDTSGVVTMSQMFSGASSFNQYIGLWDIS